MYYIIKTEKDHDLTREDAVASAFKAAIGISNELNEKRLVIHIPNKNEFEYSVIATYLKKRVDVKSYFEIDLISDNTLKYFKNDDQIIFSYMTTSKGLSFLVETHSQNKAIIVLPKSNNDFEGWPEVKFSFDGKSFIDGHANIECLNKIKELTRRLNGCHVSTQANEMIAMTEIKHMKNKGFCTNAKEVKNLSIAIGWPTKEAEKLSKFL